MVLDLVAVASIACELDGYQQLKNADTSHGLFVGVVGFSSGDKRVVFIMLSSLTLVN